MHVENTFYTHTAYLPQQTVMSQNTLLHHNYDITSTFYDVIIDKQNVVANQ